MSNSDSTDAGMEGSKAEFSVLCNYTFSKSDFPTPMPRSLDPGIVAAFVRQELSRSGHPRLAELLIFYDRRELVPLLLDHVQGLEANEQNVLRAAPLLRAIGYLGTVAQQKAGLLLFPSFLHFPYTNPSGPMKRLAHSYASYRATASLKPIQQALQDQVTRLGTTAAEGMTRRSLEDLQNDINFHLPHAWQVQQEFSQQAFSERLHGLIRIYLDLDMRHHDFMAPWTQSRLIHHGRGPQRKAVLSALRQILQGLSDGTVLDSTQRELDKTRRNALRSVVLHAIAFFGGKLNAAQWQELRSSDDMLLPPFSLDAKVLSAKLIGVNKKITESIHFIGNKESKAAAIESVNTALMKYGNLGVYGDLSSGLAALLKTYEIKIEDAKSNYRVEIWPRSVQEGHDFSFLVDKKTKKISDVVVGEITAND